MKLLAIERELSDVTAEDFGLYLADEALRAWELYQAGIIRELYFCADRHEALLMLECRDVEEAQEMLDTLPVVREKLITFELIPLAPYPGFARLFAVERS